MTNDGGGTFSCDHSGAPAANTQDGKPSIPTVTTSGPITRPMYLDQSRLVLIPNPPDSYPTTLPTPTHPPIVVSASGVAQGQCLSGHRHIIPLLQLNLVPDSGRRYRQDPPSWNCR